MAEHWQQWMPFHIDRFRGSPEVQAMHPIARWGYLSLLSSQWQSEDCTLSSDPLDLASASGLGDELWSQYSARILRKFPPQENGERLRNEVCYVEWQKAREKFESKRLTPEEQEELRQKRSAAGIAGNEKRWGNRKTAMKESQKVANCEEDSRKTIADDRLTRTGTYTSTEQKQKTSAKAVIELPPWIDSEIWAGYLEVRKKKRAVMTERALKGIIDRLAHFGDRGYEPMELLANSVRGNWIDIYEPKTNGGTNGNSKATSQQQRNIEHVLSRHEGRKNEGGGAGRGDGSGVIDAALRLDSTGPVGSLGSGSGEFDF